MKILNVNLSIDPECGGGTAERTYQLTKTLLQLGVNCKVLILEISKSNNRFIKLSSSEIISIPCLNKRYYIPKPYLSKIRKVVEGIDVIHLMNHWTLLNAFVYIYAKLCNKPYIFCPAGSLSYIGRSSLFKKIYNYLIGRRILRDASRCIVISIDEIPYIKSFGVNENKIIHISNGINKEDYSRYDVKEFKKKFDISDKDVILFVGRLNLIKGIDLLFDAFCDLASQLPEYQLLIAGQDEGLRNELEAKVIRYSLEKQIKFLGFLDSKQKSSAYRLSKLLVIPSRQEAMSIVVLEAGITGTPVLITNKCGFDEAESISGGMVVKATKDDIEKGLRSLLIDDANLLEMGENLKKHIQENYLWENIASKYYQVFDDVFNESRMS